METKFNITLTYNEEDEQYRLRSDWDFYDIPIDIDSAVGILTLLSHQFIDLQNEQTQQEFERELFKNYKLAMIERFDKIEPLDE